MILTLKKHKQKMTAKKYPEAEKKESSKTSQVLR